MSKVITGEALGSCQPLQLPDVRGNTLSAGAGGGFITVGELQQIHKQAYDEGFAQGKKEGFTVGQAELKSQAQRMREIINTLTTPLAEVDDQVIEELVKLAAAIAKHLVRREFKMDPGQIIAIIREAVGQLPMATRNIRLELHPEDAVVVRQALTLEEDGQSWQIVETPIMTRGGCRVVTDTSQVDATLEARYTAIVAALLGGEREDDQPVA
jgi:flagellar assembly protein FliH